MADGRTALSQLLVETSLVGVGKFRVRPDNRRFHDSGPIDGTIMVFPREPVAITHAGKRTVVADPTRVMFYNLGQEYRRDPISPAGDRCEWLALPPRAVAEAVRRHRSVEDDRPFGELTHGSVDARAFLLARMLFDQVRRAVPVDSLVIDEIAFELLDHLVARALAPVAPVKEESTRGHADIAAAAEELLALRYGETLSLAAIAAAVGTSPFHLARIFRKHTGESLHGRRTQLRLHAALLRILDGGDLTRVALDVGLSSHSHLSTAFRGAFGIAPSKLRGLPPSCLARLVRSPS